MRTFHVTAFWDPEARVWCSETDIRGLVIETKTLDEFEEVMEDLAGEMIEANHRRPEGADGRNLVDGYIIVWERPPVRVAREFVDAA